MIPTEGIFVNEPPFVVGSIPVLPIGVTSTDQLLLAKPRSPHWAKVRDEHLEKNPNCAGCGGRSHLNVHHKKPFHLHPDLELEPTNLITLCEEPSRMCHYHFGHNSLSWACYNPHVEEDATLFAKRRQEAKYE
jgi:hypothetical protein